MARRTAADARTSTHLRPRDATDIGHWLDTRSGSKFLKAEGRDWQLTKICWCALVDDFSKANVLSLLCCLVKGSERYETSCHRSRPVLMYALDTTGGWPSQLAPPGKARTAAQRRVRSATGDSARLCVWPPPPGSHALVDPVTHTAVPADVEPARRPVQRRAPGPCWPLPCACEPARLRPAWPTARAQRPPRADSDLARPAGPGKRAGPGPRVTGSRPACDRGPGMKNLRPATPVPSPSHFAHTALRG
jgi:hypothetical protein